MTDVTAIVTALGGVDNVVELEPCITRLRVRVADPDRVDDAALQALGAAGVRHTGREIQIVYGPDAEAISADLAKLLPAGVTEPGGLAPLPADGHSRAAGLVLGSADVDDAEEATGE